MPKDAEDALELSLLRALLYPFTALERMRDEERDVCDREETLNFAILYRAREGDEMRNRPSSVERRDKSASGLILYCRAQPGQQRVDVIGGSAESPRYEARHSTHQFGKL